MKKMKRQLKIFMGRKKIYIQPILSRTLWLQRGLCERKCYCYYCRNHLRCRQFLRRRHFGYLFMYLKILFPIFNYGIEVFWDRGTFSFPYFNLLNRIDKTVIAISIIHVSILRSCYWLCYFLPMISRRRSLPGPKPPGNPIYYSIWIPGGLGFRIKSKEKSWRVFWLIINGSPIFHI